MNSTKPDFASGENPDKVKIITRGFILMALLNLVTFASWQMILTGLPLYLDMLGTDPIYVGLTTTLATGAAVIVRPISGIAIDRYGRKAILIAGFMVMALSIVFYAIIPVAGAVLALRFLHGLGWGFGSTASSTIAADIIPRKRFAEAMGYFAMTNSLAMALAPALTIMLMDNGLSQIMIYTAAGFTLLSLLIATILFTTDYEQPPLKNDIPLSRAFKPENMFEKSAMFPSFVMFFLSMGSGAISTFVALMGVERRIEGIALYFVVYAMSNFVSRPLTGRWADQKGFFWPGIMSCILSSASLAILALAQGLPAIIAAGILVGLGIGTAMGVFQTMSVAIAPPNFRGAATSTFLFLFNLGIAVGAFVAGLLVEPIGYMGMFLVMGAFSLVACVVFLCGGRARIDHYHILQHS